MPVERNVGLCCLLSGSEKGVRGGGGGERVSRGGGILDEQCGARGAMPAAAGR